MVGWATSKSGGTASETVVNGSHTGHSLQFAVRTKMRGKTDIGYSAFAAAASLHVYIVLAILPRHKAPISSFSGIDIALT